MTDPVCRHDEVTLVLSVFIIQDDDHVALSESLKSTLDTVKAIRWKV